MNHADFDQWAYGDGPGLRRGPGRAVVASAGR
jgi:hypothetical protein